jgi:hypothetical protein
LAGSHEQRARLRPQASYGIARCARRGRRRRLRRHPDQDRRHDRGRAASWRQGHAQAEREPLAALALTTDTSALTAIGNDYGFEHVFSRQVRGLGKKGDVLVGLSTSGKSPNVLAALDAAREMGIVTIGFTGKKGGDMSSCCDIVLNAPSDKTPVIQQIHVTAAHIVCGLVERAVGAKR